MLTTGVSEFKPLLSTILTFPQHDSILTSSMFPQPRAWDMEL